MEALFDGLSPRQAPPAAARERAFAAAHQAFQAQRSQRARRGRALLAVAACLLIALAVPRMLTLPGDAFDVELADATGLEVDGTRLDSTLSHIEVSPGTRMRAMQPVRLTLEPATDLRLDAGTQIRWQGPEQLELMAGTVYVDTGDQGGMTVFTAHGTITDIGTRFLVSSSSERLEVAMRSGRTRFESPLGVYEAGANDIAGDVLTVAGQQVEHRSEATSAARWQWINTVPRGYQDARVQRLLEQIARDQGLALAYADPGTHAWVMNMELKGERLDRLTPAQAMQVIAAASDTTITVRADRTLYVSRR